MAASQNVEAVYNYLRVMSTHRLDPTVIPIPQLIELLDGEHEDIKGSPRLALPIDAHGNQVEDYYKNNKEHPSHHPRLTSGDGHNSFDRCFYANDCISSPQPTSNTP